MRRMRKGLALLLALALLAAPFCAVGADTAACKISGSANTGGTVTSAECEKGGEAVVSVKANTGYRPVSLLVDGVSVDPVDIRDDKYVLRDVQKDTAVHALFVRNQAADFAARFMDVKQTAWYYGAVNMLTGLGIIEGVTASAYRPGANITRAQFVKLLYELADTLGVEVKENADFPFLDVQKEGYWAAGFIGWAYGEDLIQGVDAQQTRFAPGSPISRQDMAVILERFFVDFLGYDLPGDTATVFTDTIHISPYAKDAVAYAVRVGLMGGHADGSFGPQGSTLRSQVAQVFYNYLFPFDKEGPMTTVENGRISGSYSGDGTVAIYKGIPYAAPPVGELRWKAPQEAKNWAGVLECTEWGASAIQPEQAPFWMWTTEFIIEDTGYSEDCLTLNVWAKDDAVGNKPVIVYIHGGGFTSGGSSCEVYDGEYMAGEDVVFVSINYRVGILGYLAHPELSAEAKRETGREISGNYGVLDQIAALEWVKKNIAAFGGNPSNVTIMGQSAGAASVNALVASPKAEGLFQHAFAMSFDSVSSNWDTLEKKQDEGKAAFGDLTLAQMRAMTTEELLEIQARDAAKGEKAYGSAPCVDGEVLTKTYRKALETGTANDVTILSGMVEGDSMLFGTWSQLTLANYTDRITGFCGNDADLAAKFLAAYPLPATEAALAATVTQLERDTMMAAQNYIAVARGETKAKNDTYLYFFTHVMPGPESALHGAFHTSDVPYFLNVFSGQRERYWRQVDYDLGEIMSSYLVNFAKTGNPNGTGLATWSKNTGGYSYMELKDACEMVTMTDAQIAFWKEIWP